MKTSTKTLVAGIAAILLGINLQAQTIFSGNPGGTSNSCGAGTAGGATGTSIGCNAGNATMTGGSNTLVGDSAGHASTTASGNTFIGMAAGRANTVADSNVAVGYQALNHNTVVKTNTAVGYQSMFGMTTCGSNCWDNYGTNTAVGFQTLYGTGAYGGTCMGYPAGYSNTSGCSTTGIGEEACRYNTTGNDNIGVGSAACHKNTTGTANTCVGDGAGDGSAYGLVINNNSLFGNGAATLIQTGSNQNSGFGDSVLYHVNASNNCAFGHRSLYANTTGTPNSAFGYNSLAKNTTGANNNAFGYYSLYTGTTSSKNAAFGDSTLYSNSASNTCAFGFTALKNNTSGIDNVAVGYQALYLNTTGGANTALGFSALLNNNGNDNVAVGVNCLKANTSAGANTAVGAGALASVTTNQYNVAMGYEALSATTGSDNTGLGTKAGFSNSSGSDNTYVGFQCGPAAGNGTGSENTFIGSGATEAGDYTNIAAIGYGATIAAGHGSNTWQLGNSAVTDIWTSATTFHTSDGRFKDNVTENVKGLAFINKLRPVTYNLNTKALDDFSTKNLPDDIKALHKKLDFTASTARVQSGFIAQEVAQASKEVGYTSSIVFVPSNINEGTYGINYAEIVVPLVKAVQELSASKDSLKTVVSKQDSINKGLQKQINQILAASNAGNNNTAGTTAISTQNINLSDADVVVLNQNQPNPFAEQTLITYNIPAGANSAQILFYDVNGKQINSVTITTKGKGALNVYANDLSNGVYSYTLIVDGKVIDTKKMVKQQ